MAEPRSAPPAVTPAEPPPAPAPIGAARLVAGVTFRDLLRRPGGWVATLLTGMLFALLIGALGLTNERGQDRIEQRSFSVAVGGDVAGAAGLLKQLESPRLAFRTVADVPDEVTASRASSGIVLPEGVDRRLAAGEQVELQMFYRASQNVSVESFNTVGTRLQEVELSRLATTNGHDVAIGGGPVVDVQELPRDERITRIQLARQLAPIAALLCIGVVTSVASVFGAARERRSIEPLLVLPMRRQAIALGIALGAYPLACLQVLAAVVLLVLTAALPASTNHQSPATLAVMLVAGTFASLLLASVGTALGCVAGSLGTGGDDAVSLGDLVAVLFVAAGVLVFVAPTIGDNPLFDAVPVLGQVLVMRDLVGGTAQPLGVVLAVISAAAVFALAVRFAGHCLADEDRLARAIR